MFIAIAVITAYLLGAVPFALLIARAAGVKDIRQVGSGNIGATNVWRSAGAGAGLIALAADILKGLAAVLAARYCLGLATSLALPVDAVLVLAGLAAVLGHVFPVYLGFKGGKGAATALGVMIMLLPLPTLVALIAFLIMAALWRYVSLATMVGALALFATVAIRRFWLDRIVSDVYFIMTFVLAVLIIVTHRKNIGRLLKGTENRFSLSSSSSSTEVGHHG